MKNLQRFVFTLLLFVVPAFALAQPADTNPREGFRLGLDIGLQALNNQADDGGGNNVTAKGPAFTLGVDLSGMVGHNSAFGGALWGAVAASPTISTNGVDVGSANDAKLSVVGVGPSFTFISDDGFYLNLVPSLTALNSSSAGQTQSAQTGVGLKVALGEEWLMSRSSGLGLAVQMLWSHNLDKDVPAITYTTLTFGVALAMTLY